MKWIAYNIGDPQDNNCIKVENSTVTHTSINITGKNNRIIVRNGAKMFFGGIKIIGNDNEVVYDGCKAMINVFMKGNGCKITVGRGSLIDESTSIVLMGQGNRVEIGEECMFAEKVEIWVELFQYPQIDAGLAASIFHRKEVNIKELKQYLAENGVEMRLI